jgi:hypothetical protein
MKKYGMKVASKPKLSIPPAGTPDVVKSKMNPVNKRTINNFHKKASKFSYTKATGGRM